MELKYAPRKCEYFCMGDCCLPGTNRSCGIDCDTCDTYKIYKQLLAEQAKNKKLVEALEKIAYRDITIKSNFF